MTDSIRRLLFVGRSGNGITSTIDSMLIGLSAGGSRAGADNGDGGGTGNRGAEATWSQVEDVMQGQGEKGTKDLREVVIEVQEKEDVEDLGEVVIKVQEEQDAEDIGEGAKGQGDESAIVRKLYASEKSGFQISTKGSVIAVDGYGLAEPKADQTVSNKLLKAYINQMFSDISGFVALIFVLKYGVRFTQQDQVSVAIVKKRFGKTIFSQRGIIVLSYGDNFELDFDENNSDAFKNWYESQSGAFCDLLQECRNRIVLFNNKTSDLAQQQQQSNELLRHVEAVQQNNKSELQNSVDISDEENTDDTTPLLDERTQRTQVSVVVSDEEDTDDKTPLLGVRTQRTHVSVVVIVKKGIDDTTTQRKCNNSDYCCCLCILILVAVCVIVELLVLRDYNII